MDSFTRSLGSTLLVTLMGVLPLYGQEWSIEKSTAPSTTKLDFVATEGTWMSLDVAPDGRSIVFDLLGHIYELPIDGGEARALTTGRSWNMFPRYSPDGTRILFTSDRSGLEDQWVLDRASNGLTNATRSDRSVYQGSWSVDGRFFYASSVEEVRVFRVYQYTLHGSRQELFHLNGPTVHLVDDTTRGRLYFEHNDQQLYGSGSRIKAYDKRTGEVSVAVERPGGAANPILSPDGRYLAYVHRDYQTTQLVLHEIDSRRERVLVTGLDRDRQDYKVYPHGSYPNMAWHPNGAEILLTYGGQLRAVNVATGTVRTIPFRAHVDRALDQTLRVSQSVPDSVARTRVHRWAQRTDRGILFETLGDIYVKEGNQLRNLTNSPEHETSPVYSPSQRVLYYASWSDDSLGGVFAQPVEGGARRKLTSLPSQYGSLALSSDGQTLAFARGSTALLNGMLLPDQTDFDLVVIGPDRIERRVTRISATANGSAHYPPSIRFDPGGRHLYFTEFESDTLVLKSIGTDGGGELTLYRFPHGSEAVLSPDLRWIVFQEYLRTWLTPFEFAGKALTVSAFDHQGFARRLDQSDGLYPEFSADGRSVSWVRGPVFYEKSIDDVLAERGGARTTDLAFDFPTGTPHSTVAFTNVRIIPVDRTSQVIARGTVVVRNNRIVALGPDVPIPSGAKVFDLPGHTIIPGLVDVHAHYNQVISPLNVIEQRVSNLQSALAHGVTTMYEVYGNSQKDGWVSDMLRRGSLVGPRLFTTGPPMYGSRFFRPKTFRVMSTMAEMREAVAYNKDFGATALKDYLTQNRRVRYQLVTAAREAGLNVEVEPGGEAQTNFTRVIDGATGLAHGMGFTSLYDDVIRLFAAAKTGITPTLIVTLDGPSGESYFYTRERLWEDPKLLRFMRRDVLLAGNRATNYWPDDQFAPRLAAQMKRLYDGGVSIQLGGHGQMPGLDAHWEMELMAQGGFSPMEILRIATINGARHEGLDKDLGSIEVGKLADLVVLRDNPLEDIRNARSIAYVMLNGVVYDGETIARVYPDPQPAKGMYFNTSH